MSSSSNQPNGAETFVRMLEAHGVDHVFGLCGDTSLPFYDALYRLDHGISHFLSRDERSAAYMADGYARVSGKVGVCEAPSGGGATYILPGVVEANESSIPILSITSDISVSSRGRYALTELDQKALFKPLTKWNTVIDDVDDIPRLMRTAFREMTTGRPGAAHIGFPIDTQRAPVNATDIQAIIDDGRYPAFPTAPNAEAVERAADIILAARNPLIICGGGVIIAGGETALLSLAETLAIPVATTISGKGSISDQHPMAVGVVGSNGGVLETRALVQQADVVIFIGCRAGSVTTERWQYPVSGNIKIVHIDSDPSVIGTNYPTAAPVVGDAKLSLEALNDALRGNTRNGADRDLNETTVANAKAAKFATFNKLAASNDTPVRPERLVATMQKLLPDDTVIVADPGTPCPYFSAYYQWSTPGRQFISNRAHGALGYSLAAAIGAQYGRPNSKIVSVMGDGSFGFTVGELETVVRLALPITFIVVSNQVFGWIKAGQHHGFGERYFSVDFDRTDHAKVAAAFGVKSWTVDNPAALESSLRQAFAHNGPSLVDVISQPLHEANAPVSEWIA
jgi:acetolactate synthase-1/2/3 large subunit